jgi:hypothetical protein
MKPILILLTVGLVAGIVWVVAGMQGGWPL